MVEHSQFDVVVVGAGIAGSTMALLLSGQGLSIAVVEAREPKALPLPSSASYRDFDPRVSALNPRSIAVLHEAGAWSSIEAYRACAYHHMSVWDAQGTGAVDFDATEISATELGYIVENRSVTNALLAQLAAATDVSILAPHTLTGCQSSEQGVVLTLDGERELAAKLLIAADGANSNVRQMLSFKTREWDYGHRAIVATVQVEHSHQATAWQRFLPSGPLAFLPLDSADQNLCSIVWSLREDLVDELLALPDEAFCEALGRAFEHRLGAVSAASPRFAFPLRQRHAVDYIKPGVALVGDAAHTIHPLAGQGINLGLQDVRVLAQELLAAQDRGVALGQVDVLARYQRRRKGENLLMMSAMDGFKRIFEPQPLPLQWLRNVGMRTLDGLGPVKRQIMRRAMGIDD